MNFLDTSNLNSKTYLTLTITYLFCAYLLYFRTEIYFNLGSHEMGFVELFGAFSLFVTSVILFCSAQLIRKTEKKMECIILIIASILFFWASGEELSWGQHILKTTTPEWLSLINDQNETNIHNINKSFFDKATIIVTLLLTMITAAAHYLNKEYLFGFKLPEYPLNFAFMLLSFYSGFFNIKLGPWVISLFLCILYALVSIRSKNKKLLMCSISTVMIGVFMICFHHLNFNLFGASRNIYHEYRETFFSVLCVVYALQLYKQMKSFSK